MTDFRLGASAPHTPDRNKASAQGILQANPSSRDGGLS